tara:strand:+ start:1130 stop:1528 length:399 start_codon:yes stop_codon:yes gene_type:complete
MADRNSHTGLIVRCDGTVDLVTFDTLESMQDAVGGLIEPLHIGPTNPNPAYATGLYAEENIGTLVDVFINEEGRINKLPLNLPFASVFGILVHGDVIITGPLDKNGAQTDLPEGAKRFPVFYREPSFEVSFD